MSAAGPTIDVLLGRGGVRGIGMIAALDVLRRQGFTFGCVGGVSVGAIIGALTVAGYRAEELKRAVWDLDLRSFRDPDPVARLPRVGPLLSVVTRLGAFRGDRLHDWIRDLLAAKGIRTFGDLPGGAAACRLRVFAADLTRGCIVEFPRDARDYGFSPDDFEVALALRASASIPFFFRPVRLGPDSAVLMDGGLLAGLAWDLFESGANPGRAVIGIQVVPARPPGHVAHRIDGPVSLLLAMSTTGMDLNDMRWLSLAGAERTICIDDCGLTGIDFDLGERHKERLYQAGRRAAERFLNRSCGALRRTRYLHPRGVTATPVPPA